MEFSKEQQEFVDKLVGEARVKASKVAKAQHEADQVKAKEDSEKAALAADQKWQELAAKHEARATELEPLQAQVATYEKLIAKMLQARIKDLGDDAKKAVEGLPESLSLLEKLGWLSKNEGLFQARGDGVGTPGKGKRRQKKSAESVGHIRKRL